jgi:hypothetical protein
MWGMADTDKPGAGQVAGRQDGQAPSQESVPNAAPTVMSVARLAVTDAVKDAVFEKRPYLRFAFANPYNLSLFFGSLAMAALTLNPLLAVVALGTEGIWLLHAPESKRLRTVLWDPRFEKLRLALEEQERAERIKPLGQVDRERVERLVARQREIRRLAAQNPSFTSDLLRGELIKTDRLVEAFIDMAITCSRYEQYLNSVDIDALDRDRIRWEKAARGGAENEPQVEIARKNLAVILRRFEKMKEIRRYVVIARGQLDLLDNSFQLIADQIVTMQSPQELSGQLDELLNGVESIRQTAADAERLLSALGVGSLTS